MKRDDVARAIGQPHAQHVPVERDRARDVGGEAQHVRQARGMHARRSAAAYRPPRAAGRTGRGRHALVIGRGLRHHPDVHGCAVHVVEPDATARHSGALGRRRRLGAARLRPLGDARKIGLEAPERHPREMLARRGAHDAPAMRLRPAHRARARRPRRARRARSLRRIASRREGRAPQDRSGPANAHRPRARRRFRLPCVPPPANDHPARETRGMQLRSSSRDQRR